MVIRNVLGAVGCVCIFSVAAPYCVAFADDLYKPGNTQSLISDRKASQIGDTITIVIVQSAESSMSMQNSSKKSSAISGQFKAGRIDEGGNISLGGSYDGSGEVRRSERFVTRMTASVIAVLPNGDLVIDGLQHLNVNGEATTVQVRGRIRAADIDGENTVPSNRIADAQINYNGKGFVSRSAKPGLIHRIFSLLGIG